MHSFLTGRYQTVKINKSYSLFIKHGVPQYSILGPILIASVASNMGCLRFNFWSHTYSLCSLKHGVPQGSLLGRKLFNIFLCEYDL